jgi:3-oxoacyl-[acyl-carrier-protein] synthase II
MGEEAAGVDAMRIAHARISSGQSEIALVGGGYNADQIGTMLQSAMGLCLWKGEPAPVWERSARGGGMVPGSLGAFVVLEDKAHAIARSATPWGRLSVVLSEHARRAAGEVTATLDRLWMEIAPRLDLATLAVVSGATGVEPATAEERAFLSERPDIPVRATTSHLGHSPEAQFAMNVALAALAVSRGRLFPSFDPSGFERAMDGALRQVAVTAVGQWRGEGLALIEALPFSAERANSSPE